MNVALRSRGEHVLLVQPRSSVWSVWRRGRCVSLHRSDTPTVPVGVPRMPRGGWRVIVDAASADIERLSSDGFGNDLVGRWQRWRFERDACRQHEFDAIDWLGRHGTAHARAALRRDVIDPELIERLRRWQDEGVFIGAVRPIEDALAAATPRRAVPRLWLLYAPDAIRHVLVIDGVTCMSRDLSDAARADDDDEAAVCELSGTVRQARERWSIASLSIQTTGMSADRARRSSEALDRALADAGGSLPIDWQVEDAEPDATARLLSRLGAARTVRGPRIPSPTTASTTALATATVASSAYAELLRPAGARRERGRLLRLVILTCLIAVISAVHAVSVGRQHARAAVAAHEARTNVEADTSRARDRLAGLHPAPERGARYLERYDSLVRRAPVAPARLLHDVATVVTRHPAVVLDGVAWAVVPASVPLGQPPVDVDPSSLAAADSTGDPVTELELFGRLVGAPSLRVAQGWAAAFADDLVGRPGIDACRLLESPLERAAIGRAQPGVTDRPGTPTVRLRCRVRGADA